jgi:hypothetical protein
MCMLNVILTLSKLFVWYIAYMHLFFICSDQWYTDLFRNIGANSKFQVPAG